MDEVKSNPEAGRELPLELEDPRWPAKQGWVKMEQTVNNIKIHYVRNTRTGVTLDFKFKN